MTYQEFLTTKRHTVNKIGIQAKFIPDYLFGFQKYVATHLVNMGRCAAFLDTGTGKTIIELVTAVNYYEHTNKPTLIVTPLAVAFQFIKEADRFDIGSIAYSKNGDHKTDIVVCNYERLANFNPNDFGCVILDESSILKNFDGQIKKQVTQFMKKVRYRFLFTATPSPNDFVELGTSSEALGYMGYTDMLTKFFKNNEDTIKPQNIGTKWILKPHAKDDFFSWVSSWSISMRKPSDLGFSDDGYNLPDLIINRRVVENRHRLVIDGQIQMFNTVARSLKEVRSEQRRTINERCELATTLPVSTCVYWVNLNDEADIIESIDKGSVQVKGSMSLDQKESILIDFSNGNIERLITKAKITAFGLNWQHCNHTIYFPTFSYEQYYQAIRRFWRYGQKSDVTVDLVYSAGQQRVVDAINAKAKKADNLFSELNKSINNYNIETIQTQSKINLPSWL